MIEHAEHGMPFVDLDPGYDDSAVALAPMSPKRRRRRGYAQVLLTDELVCAAVCGNREAWVQDAINPFLVLRIRPAGGKSFYFICSERELQDSRRTFLGGAMGYTVAEARIKAQWEQGRQYIIKAPPKLRRDMRIGAVVTEYLQSHPEGDSDWFKTVAGLFRKYLLPRYGVTSLSGIRKDQWLLLIEKAALEQRSRGANLHKALRAFLTWAVSRGLLQANPLAKVVLDLPPTRPAAYLTPPELVAIYEAAQPLGSPWSAMLGLVILTGEAMEYVRSIKQNDIDWTRGVWTVEWDTWGDCPPRPLRKVALPQDTLALIAPFMGAKDYLFQSPRALLASPINFHAAIMEQLKAATVEITNWTLWDCRRAAHREIQRRAGGDKALHLWAMDFASLRSKRRSNNLDDDVVL